MRPIVKEDLLTGDSIFLSVLSGIHHLGAFVPFLRELFGIDTKKLSGGYEVKEEHVDRMMSFAKSRCFCGISPAPPFLDVKFPRSSNERVKVYYDSMLRLVKKIEEGQFNVDLVDIFADIINLVFGAHHGLQPYALPNMCFLKSKHIQQLYSFYPTEENSPTIPFNDTFFSKSLHKQIVDGNMRNIVADLISLYDSRKVPSDQKLIKMLSVISIHDKLFLNVSIDLPTRMVRTMNPVYTQVDPGIGRRKWIAKIAAISEHYLSSQPSTKEMYLGPIDMVNSFLPDHVATMHQYHKLRYSFFHEERRDLSSTPHEVQFPLAMDNNDAGLFAIWYGLLSFYEGADKNDLVDLDPDLRRRQLLFCLVVLRLYQEKMNDPSYVFLSTFNVKSWLVDTKWDNGLQEVFRSVLGDSDSNDQSAGDRDDDERKEDTLDPQQFNHMMPFMQSEGVFDFMKELSNALNERRYYFFARPLKPLVDGCGGVFPDTLISLSKSTSSTISVNVHWNFHNKQNLVDTFREVIREVFDSNDTEDIKAINYVLDKKTTYFISVQAKSEVDGQSSKPPVFLSFASVTAMSDKENFKCLYVDYLGTTTKSPKDVLADYDHMNFTGRGLGKFMINLLQCLSFCLSTSKTPTTKIALKAAADKASFYTSMGFVVMKKNHRLLQLDSVTRHSLHVNIDPELKSYILNDFAVIDHKKVMFINHVHHPLSDVAFSTRFEESIVANIHAVFDTEDFRNRLQIIARNRQDEKDTGAFFLPIGLAIVEIFKKFKPIEYSGFSGVYESVIKSISWSIYVDRAIKVQRKKSSIDDLKNPDGNISVFCNKCSTFYDNMEFGLSLTPEDDGDDNATRSKVMALLDFFFDQHFQVSNQAVSVVHRCEETDYTKLKNARDMELNVIGFNEHYARIGKELFKKLILLFLQVHLQRQEILDYFDWHQWRPTRYNRHTKLISNRRRQKETINAVLGLNEKQQRLDIAKKNKDKIEGNRRRRTVREWEKFWDDMIFLKHMRHIMFVKRIHLTDGQMDDIVNEVSNSEVYNDKDYMYWVGYPGRSVDNTVEDVVYLADNFDRGKRRKKSGDGDDDDNDIDEDDDEEADEEEEKEEEEEEASKERVQRVRYSRRFHRPRFLDWKWIKENLTVEQIRAIKRSPNRQCALPNDVLEKIQSNMRELRQQNITHIYKYTCPTTYQMKFCNVIQVRSQRRDRADDGNYQKMFGDEITREWLYTTAVTLNNCKDWFNDVMDPSTTDKIYELPVASVATEVTSIPERVTNAPDLKYPQNGQGTCGISAFSSSFHYCFNETLSLAIYQKRDEYLKVLSKDQASKRSSSMIFLSNIINHKTFKAFVTRRMRQVVHWKQLLRDPHYSRIMLCIPRSSSFSKDHIIGITHGWIFDGNLLYAIPLNEENLTWCTSHGKRGEVFTNFIEQMAVFPRDPNFEGKSKSK